MRAVPALAVVHAMNSGCWVVPGATDGCGNYVRLGPCLKEKGPGSRQGQAACCMGLPAVSFASAVNQQATRGYFSH